MTARRKLIIKNKKNDTVRYTIRAGNEIIWQGNNINKILPGLKQSYKGKTLTVSWHSSKEFLSA